MQMVGEDKPMEDLPDPQNRSGEAIRGANVAIQQVGVSQFRLPMRIATGNGEIRELETCIQTSVGLPADRKGINMSRLLRALVARNNRPVDFQFLKELLENYQIELQAPTARVRMEFSVALPMKSLRSGLSGLQYYDVAMEASLNGGGRLSRRLHLDFVYSSACPCAVELSEHAREYRGIPAIPHSQRSRARISIELATGAELSFAEIRDLCQNALKTETQVLVRRTDEQAFAELNAESPKFVEDAARILYAAVDPIPAIADFQIACAHLESLHNHDAVALIVKGIPGGFTGEDFPFKDLVC